MKFDRQLTDFVLKMKIWASELGFSGLRITDIRLPGEEERLQRWLARGFHGEMHYMAAHGLKRCRPDELLPGTLRVVSVRMNYIPGIPDICLKEEMFRKDDPLQARISFYARGRDYHRVIRSRLARLAGKMQESIGPFRYRVFTDSAPVMEVALARKAGMGWQGKNNLLLCRQGGSFFFLGEMLVDLPLPVDPEEKSHCGNCERCFRHCPTNAIVEPNLVDARRCISYLTIELKGAIPVELRPLIGNRIYGCDDCQLVCPWNRFAERAKISDFNVRHGFDRSGLLDLFSWTEAEFHEKTEGSAIRRIGYDRWIRNIAVALGNALRDMENESVRDAIVHALNKKKSTVSEMVDEHIVWALHQGS